MRFLFFYFKLQSHGGRCGLVTCMVCTVGRKLLQPFGQDVSFTKNCQSELEGKMPDSELIVKDIMLRLLTSNGERWMRVRVVMTESHLFISKFKDKDTALHGVPLHEIVSISKRSTSVPDDDDEYSVPQQGSDATTLDMATNPTADSKPRSVYGSLVIETAQTGINFGRTFALRFSSEASFDELAL